MSHYVFTQEIVTGQAYQFHIQEKADSVLVDFTGWTFEVVGRSNINVDPALFRYTESDVFLGVPVAESGVFTLTDLDGNTEDFNLKITIPSEATESLRVDEHVHIHVGVRATDPGGNHFQLIPNAKVRVCESVAP